MKKLLVLACTGIVLLTSCATQQYSSSGVTASAYDVNTDRLQTEKNDGIERLVRYSADIHMDTKQPDSVMLHVASLAKKYGGYMQSMNSGVCSIRVKSEHFTAAVTEISGFGKVTEKNIRSEDVTDAFNDYKVRLENAEKSRQRYMELLQKAQTIEDILRVEKEIDRLTLDIEQLKGKLALLTDQTSYSTISVDVHEKVKPGVISYAFIGIYKGVKWLFVRG